MLFSPLERGGASLYSPLSIAFRFETQLEVSFQIIKFFAMFCVLLNLRLNLKSVNGCRAEVECNRLEFPLAKSKEKLFMFKRYAPSFRLQCGLRVRFFHCLLFATLSGNLTPPLILHNSSFFRGSTRTVLFFYMVIY